VKLRVDPWLLRARFGAGCDTSRCNAACCRTGVWLDVVERDRVLAHAERVRRVMSRGQPRDTRRWFSRRVTTDPDFPSGRAVHTRVLNGGCVFLDGDRRCVLQKASAAGGPRLKPFFCTAFPVTIDRGVLTLEDRDHRSRRECCASERDGRLTVFDVCRRELRHALGAAGLASLRKTAAAPASARSGRRP
jgi:Fe-S-cluster containining protein